MKKCTKCGVQKPLSEFYENKRSKNGLLSSCKICENERQRDYYFKNKNKVIERHRTYKKQNHAKITKYQKEHHLKSKYGVTIDRFEKMKMNQDFKCAICRQDFTKTNIAVVDHCHKSEKVRDLLCKFCNTMLGMAKENIDTLRSAQKYLQKHAKKVVKK